MSGGNPADVEAAFRRGFVAGGSHGGIDLALTRGAGLLPLSWEGRAGCKRLFRDSQRVSTNLFTEGHESPDTSRSAESNCKISEVMGPINPLPGS